MSRIVFFCIPAHGHTNPTLGVIRELILQGNEVWYYSYELFREKIEATGARFISCDAYDMEQRLSPKDAVRIGKDLTFSIQILVDTTLALGDMVCRDMQAVRPDCIVADSMAVWGKAVARKLGIPFVSSTTTFAFNRYSAKIMEQNWKQMVSMLFSMPKINKHIKRLQNMGYPVKNFLDIIQNDDDTHTIVYTSPEFQPCADTFSDKYAFVGPSIRPSENCIQKTKEKLIYISMGTVVNDMLDFYKSCISAFQDTEYQVILSVGNLVEIGQLGILPENITAFPYVDQIAVLKQADVFVTHCGMNSVNESLYFGVPMVMFPQTSEQSGVANRVLQVGAGVKLEKISEVGLRKVVDCLIQDKSYKNNANIISDGFRKCSGAKGAAEKILQVCYNRK